MKKVREGISLNPDAVMKATLTIADVERGKTSARRCCQYTVAITEWSTAELNRAPSPKRGPATRMTRFAPAARRSTVASALVDQRPQLNGPRAAVPRPQRPLARVRERHTFAARTRSSGGAGGTSRRSDRACSGENRITRRAPPKNRSWTPLSAVTASTTSASSVGLESLMHASHCRQHAGVSPPRRRRASD